MFFLWKKYNRSQFNESFQFLVEFLFLFHCILLHDFFALYHFFFTEVENIKTTGPKMFYITKPKVTIYYLETFEIGDNI